MVVHSLAWPRRLPGMRALASGLLLCFVAAASAGGLLACRIGTNGQLETGDSSVTDAGNELDVGGQRDVGSLLDAGPADSGVADVQEEPPPSVTCNVHNCGGACCGGQCVSQTCASCGAAAHFCTFDPGVTFSSGTCVEQCSSCSPDGTPLGTTCFVCNSGKPVAKCSAASSACPQTLVAGACPCPSGDAGDCPGPNQICQGNDAGQFACVTP
jgi:hypothetical protein